VGIFLRCASQNPHSSNVRQLKEVAMSPLKYLLALVLILIMPFVYGYYMLLWSGVSMSIVEVLNTPATISLAIINVIAVIVLSLILAIPLNHIFSAHTNYVVVCAAVAIIAWQLFTFLSADTVALNIINYSEWLALLLCMPLIVSYANKLRHTNA
jgi:hypothetical protein